MAASCAALTFAHDDLSYTPATTINAFPPAYEHCWLCRPRWRGAVRDRGGALVVELFIELDSHRNATTQGLGPHTDQVSLRAGRH